MSSSFDDKSADGGPRRVRPSSRSSEAGRKSKTLGLSAAALQRRYDAHTGEIDRRNTAADVRNKLDQVAVDVAKDKRVRGWIRFVSSTLFWVIVFTPLHKMLA